MTRPEQQARSLSLRTSWSPDVKAGQLRYMKVHAGIDMGEWGLGWEREGGPLVGYQGHRGTNGDRGRSGYV